MTRLDAGRGRPRTPYSRAAGSTWSDSDQALLAATANTTYVASTSTSSRHGPITLAVRSVEVSLLPLSTRLTRSSSMLAGALLVSDDPPPPPTANHSSTSQLSECIIIIIYLLKSTEQEDAHMINTRTRAGQERHRKLALTCF